jgi:hypothetical protein
MKIKIVLWVSFDFCDINGRIYQRLLFYTDTMLEALLSVVPAVLILTAIHVHFRL